MPYINKVELATKYAWSMIGLPYKWGGDDPMAGFDCSGYCIEIMKSVGIFPRGGDWTAQILWDKYRSKEVDRPEEGALVFWYDRSQTRVIHVEYCLDHLYALGASGGGSRTITVADATSQNAYIKMRPIQSRSGIAGYIYLF